MPRPSPPPPRRRGLRLARVDYAATGACFVTLCTADRRHLFGEVSDGRLRPSPLGEVAARCWREIPRHFTAVALDAQVVMPNHLHGIVVFERGRGHDRPEERARAFGQCPGDPLASVVRAFKAAVTRQARADSALRVGEAVWQRGFVARVVRSAADLDRVREYILANPLRWHLDRENPDRTGSDELDPWLESLAPPSQG